MPLAGWLADLLGAVLDVVHADAHDLAHLVHTSRDVSAAGHTWGCRQSRGRGRGRLRFGEARTPLMGAKSLTGLETRYLPDLTTCNTRKNSTTRCRRGRRPKGGEGSAPRRRRPDQCRPSSPARACPPRHSPPSDRPPRCSGLRSEGLRGVGRTGGQTHVSSSTPQWVAPPISNCTMRMLPEQARVRLSWRQRSSDRKRKCGAHLRSPAPPAFCSRASTAAASAATLS